MNFYILRASVLNIQYEDTYDANITSDIYEAVGYLSFYYLKKKGVVGNNVSYLLLTMAMER